MIPVTHTCTHTHAQSIMHILSARAVSRLGSAVWKAIYGLTQFAIDSCWTQSILFACDLPFMRDLSDLIRLILTP